MHRPLFRPAFAFYLALLLCTFFGCDDDPATQGHDGAVDMAPSEDARPDEGRPEDGLPPDEGPPDNSCVYPDECPDGDCVEGECVFEAPARCDGDDPAPCAPGEVCDDPALGGYCALPCELDGSCQRRPRPCTPRCPLGQICVEDLCVNACETDLDCPEDGECFNGRCQRYVGAPVGAPAIPLGQPGQIYAGVGVTPLSMPVGVSLAGFGNRAGPNTPYAIELGGSDRVLERQDARALVISDADDLLILIRAPLCFPTDFLITRTAWHLRQLTVDAEHPDGIDYADHILLAATHSHSQPARYWNLLSNLSFGTFGFGLFSLEITDRVARSMAEAAAEALDDAQPASFGWTLLDGFDPEGRIHTNRRSEGPDIFDDRMFIWRIDDAEGEPLAAMVNFGIHGTHMNDTWITGDVHGAVEVVAGEVLSEQAGRVVPVLYTNGAGGNTSPRGDDATDTDWAKMQVVGHRVAALVAPAFAGIETRADIDVELITERVAISRDILGYEAEAFRTRSTVHTYGAFQCLLEGRNWSEDPAEDGDLGCLLDIARVVGFPVPQNMQTTLTALRLGDLFAVTLPGEPSSEITLMVSQAVQAEGQSAGQPITAMALGYAQDHMFYLLGADDWFHGGYESSTSTWGWRLGEYLVDRSRDIAARLLTPEREPWDRRVKPHWWTDLADDTISATPGSEAAGGLIDAPGPRASRGSQIVLRWHGGHPGVDLPNAWLARPGAAGAMEMVTNALGQPVDISGFDSILRYLGDYSTDHRWSLRWELPFELDPGTYHVIIEGHGVSTEGGSPEQYRIESPAMEITPASLQLQWRQAEDGGLIVSVNLPDGPSTDTGGPFDGLRPTGSLWRHGPDLNIQGSSRGFSMILGGPAEGLRAVWTPAGGMSASLTPLEVRPGVITRTVVFGRDAGGTEQRTELEGWPTTEIHLAPLQGPGRLEIYDQHQNVGSVDF
ncbi:MAG: hypothetical protein ACE366_30855 [Bradymonadia bacterium]